MQREIICNGGRRNGGVSKVFAYQQHKKHIKKRGNAKTIISAQKQKEAASKEYQD